MEQISNIANKVSFFHLNMLLFLGLALFGGSIGGRIFQRFRIPQVVGYIIIGVLIGEAGFKLVDHNVIETLQPFNYFALGLIGFMVGGELRKDVFQRYGKQLMIILLCEGIAPFILVTLLITSLGFFIFGDIKISLALGLLFGAIASATDPATTTDVLREYKTRGPLTRTILGIVALDDGLALLLFVIASSIAGSLVGNFHTSIFRVFLHPLYEIGVAVAIGGISGVILNKILAKHYEKDKLLAFAIGAVLFVTGLSLAIKVEMLLAAMTMGVIVVNYRPRKSKEIFELVNGFAPPIYVLFFVFVGAKLSISNLSFSLVIIVLLYLIGTILGKAFGARFGARISGAPKSVQKYLSLGLFSQAGIAIG
jgi:Kef-type K+ transport system membrane component KefB